VSCLTACSVRRREGVQLQTVIPLPTRRADTFWLYMLALRGGISLGVLLSGALVSVLASTGRCSSTARSHSLFRHC
jgi:hypothetical protein